MNWLELLLIITVLAGLFAGAVLVAQRPTFWLGLGTVLFKALLPKLMLLAQRMPPDEEKAWRECQKRGGKWNYRTKKCE